MTLEEQQREVRRLAARMLDSAMGNFIDCPTLLTLSELAQLCDLNQTIWTYLGLGRIGSDDHVEVV